MPKPRSPEDITWGRIHQRLLEDPRLMRVAQGVYLALAAAGNSAALIDDPDALAQAAGVTAEELWEFNAVIEGVENEQLRT